MLNRVDNVLRDEGGGALVDALRHCAVSCVYPVSLVCFFILSYRN